MHSVDVPVSLVRKIADFADSSNSLFTLPPKYQRMLGVNFLLHHKGNNKHMLIGARKEDLRTVADLFGYDPGQVGFLPDKKDSDIFTWVKLPGRVVEDFRQLRKQTLA
jgi:hypothetical protein